MRLGGLSLSETEDRHEKVCCNRAKRGVAAAARLPDSEKGGE